MDLLLILLLLSLLWRDRSPTPIVIVLLIVQPRLIDCCFPGGRLIRRMPKKEPALVYKQHVPNLPENALTASGPREGRIKRNDRRFNELVANHNPDIIFKDEELTGADRLMSLRCKEKLDALSMLVMNYWPGVKLRVTDAWDEDGLHPADSLHYEGRAVDITTSDRDRSKYGMLARLAAQAGFDWVYYEVRSHVHASVKSDTSTRNKRTLRCFPENATVLLKSGRRVPIGSLKIGDHVMTMSSEYGTPSFASVIANLHIDRNSINEFIDVTTINGTRLTVSGDHLLYIVRRSDDLFSDWKNSPIQPVFAKDLLSDDSVLVYNKVSGAFVPQRIARTVPIIVRGLYAPLTVDGTIVVDDVAASCYAGVISVEMAHSSMAPVRLWDKLTNSYLPSNFVTFARNIFSYSTSEGILWYADLLQRLAELLDKLNIVSLTVV